jgi:hypothetical protein
MFSSHVAVRNKSVFTMLCFSLGLFAPAAAMSQEAEVAELEVVGGNSSNSLMFGLNYGLEAGDVDEAITLNDDANAYPSLNSFTFVRNTCGESRTDIVAASTNASQLVIYDGGRGTGSPICGGTGQAACPARPVGLSTSIEQLISVATSGASGSTPGVFTFTAGNDESTCATFSRSGGALSVGSNRIRAIADTEFVRGNGGDLEAGDLLVLVSNPAMIVRVTPDGIGQGGASGAEFANSLAVFSSYRRATPTGLAIVPGETPNILVTLSTGAIVNFFYDYDGSGWAWKSFDTGGLFPNPRGIGAGSREGVPYIVVSEQNRGRYIRVEVEEDTSNGGLKRSSLPREIVTPVGAPEGVAVSQEDPDLFVATKCFNPESEEPTGCNFGPGDLHFSQGFEGGLEGESLRFDIRYIPDPTDNSARDENGLLRLPHPCDDDASCVAQDFFVPASCRGYVADKALGFKDPQLVLVDIDLLGDFFVTSGNFAQVTERVKDTLGVDGECTETGARVYYHPSKDLDDVALPGGTLFDVTVSCQNPSRGISELRSPVVFCVDPNYVARKADPDGEVGRNEFVNPHIRIFIEDLKAAVAELGSDFPALSSELNSLLVGFTNPDMGSGKVPAYYFDTSFKADEGALAVLELKRAGAFTDADLPIDLYARLLRGFLGLAFYSKETGALEKYYPPAEFCRVVDGFNEYPEGSGVYFSELQDVLCDCTSVLNPDPNEYSCAPGTIISP